MSHEPITSTTSKAILVTGATGKQGGSVVKALIDADADVEILALTRNPQSSLAQKLQQRSSKIKLVKGNLNNPTEIFVNAKEATTLPIWGVFSVQGAMEPGAMGNEEKQGKDLVDEALQNNVKFFVYTSVDRGGARSIDNPTNVPHFITKHNIEKHLIERTKNGGMDWVILRPVAFFENFVPGFFGKVFTTSWIAALKQKPLQLISVADIGFFAAQAFLKPQEYKDKSLSLAGDELSFDQMAKVFKAKTGDDVPTTWHFVCWFLMWMAKDFGSMFKWFADEGYGADIAELRRMHPGLKDFGAWLEKDSGFKVVKQ